MTENKRRGRARWHCDDELNRSNKGAGKGNQKTKRCMAGQKGREGAREDSERWTAGDGRSKLLLLYASLHTTEPSMWQCKCCRRRRLHPLLQTTADTQTDRPTVQHWLLITVAEALMALGNLVVIKFNMPNTNYCYVSRFTLSNVTLCQWLCLVPLCLVRCMSSCFSAFNDWTPEKAEASLKCPIDKGAPFWWPTQHSLTGARQSSCAHL